MTSILIPSFLPLYVVQLCHFRIADKNRNEEVRAKTSSAIEKSARGSGAALWMEASSFSLFLFGVGLLTDNAAQPAHSH